MKNTCQELERPISCFIILLDLGFFLLDSGEANREASWSLPLSSRKAALWVPNPIGVIANAQEIEGTPMAALF